MSYLGVTSTRTTLVDSAGNEMDGASSYKTATGAITNVNSVVSLTHMGAPGYEVVVTPNPADPLIATLQFYDPVSGSNRALFKAGVGELDVGSVPMLGQTTPTWYRGVSFNGFAVRVTAYTSGSATVTIYSSSQTSGTFQNNPVHTTEEGALRNGRAFTASSSVISVPAGQFLNFLLANPSNNNLRLIIQSRILVCDLPGASAPIRYFGISNPTVNLPATVATVSNRKTGGATSASIATFNVAATRMDMNPTNANPIGGILPTAGAAYSIPGLVTIEPGTSRGNWIANTGTAATVCSINYQWIEEIIS